MIFETDDVKTFRSHGYNYNFNKHTGYFERWGVTKEDDPEWSPDGPEIADIEITTICGGPEKPCHFCYKGNTLEGSYMSFEKFKRVFGNLPKTITQIAFGVDAKLESNPDTFKIFQFCRDNGVIPNVTVANISRETANKLANVAGAVAVSRYANKDWCYESIRYLYEAGLKQINIHQLLATSTINQVYETIDDYHTDPRLKGLNAIVFLSLKKVGRGVKLSSLTQEQFKGIIDYSLEKRIKFGFDSCSAHKFLKSVKDSPNYNRFEQMADPCESSLFSLYINTEGKYFPCSFSEGDGDWVEGIDLTSTSFNDVWNHEKTKKFRDNLLCNGRNCPLFEI